MRRSPPWYWPLVVQYVRRELPAWGRVYDLAGGSRHERWSDAGTVTVRGKLHGYSMQLDLGNWSERLTWCLARYHDLPLQTALISLLCPGDAFVDIGANLGMLSLLAHRRIAPEGRVIACEPNPRMQERIQAAVAANGLRHFTTVGTALGEREGIAELHEFAGHAGWGSLSSDGPEGARRTASWTVPIRVGDGVLAELPARQPIVMKIDVEGHEVPVLRGLRQTLRQRLPLVFVEVADAHQRRAGYSAAELRGALEQHGYRGFALRMDRRFAFGRKLVVQPIEQCELAEIDALFVPPHGPLAERFHARFPGHQKALPNASVKLVPSAP